VVVEVNEGSFGHRKSIRRRLSGETIPILPGAQFRCGCAGSVFPESRASG
jgi:hypothetical protein